MGQKLRIDASALIVWAMAILLLPMDWYVSTVLATGIHELGHYVCARILKIPVYSICISAGGCRMETAPMHRMQEFLCAAAGPIASLMLFLLFRWMPILGFCGMVQGAFNLLPIYPMDGGRILRCVAGERASHVVSLVTSLFLAGMGIYLTFFQNMGLIPLIFGLLLMFRSGSTKYFLQS